MDSRAYYRQVVDLLTHIEDTQSAMIAQAGCLIKQSFDQEGVLHVFSTGHSHMMVEEMFYRTGGLIPVNPLFDPGTMLHQGAQKSTQFERLPGYAKVILQNVEIQPGEPILIISNSGINPVPVEMALMAKEKQMKVIAITSKGISSKLSSRLPSGQKLMDVADLVIDNCIEDSDAAIEVGDSGQSVCAVSTVIGAYIVERIVLEVTIEYQKENRMPPIFASANIPGGDEWNKKLIEKYKGRIRVL